MKAILEVTSRVLRITPALLLYRLLQLVSFPFVFLYIMARLAFRRAYWSHFGERLGFLPRTFSRTKSGCIWLHAVSAGEVISAVPLIQQLRADQPRIPIYLSTSTLAGRRAAEHRLMAQVDGIFYAPYDYVSCVRRVLRRIRPALLLILETEIWPNLFNEAKRCGVGLAIVNARISDRSWPRYRRARRFFGGILCLPDLVMVQSATDRSRFAELGATESKLYALGNLKYDAAILRRETTHIPTFGAQHIWIAASTVGPNERGSSVRHTIDEDQFVIAGFQNLAAEFPGLLLILAPRQPDRFDEVVIKLKNAGVPFLRRTELRLEGADALQLP
ncbi:MAG: hypothetical protein JOZ62_02975, partial [Acidobacteriaceae bacterium]|nr:hypothetical protein [Acidobacteriaceae bacterium]